MGAEVVVGNLLDLNSMHRVIAGCETMYFGMSVSDALAVEKVELDGIPLFNQDEEMSPHSKAA